MADEPNGADGTAPATAGGPDDRPDLTPKAQAQVDKAKRSPWYLFFGGSALLVAAIFLFLVLQNDDDGPSDSAPPTTAADGPEATTGPDVTEAPDTTDPGSAARLDQLIGDDTAADLLGMDEASDVATFSSADELWAGLAEPTQAFEALDFQEAQNVGLQVVLDDPGTLPTGVVAQYTVQRWQFADPQQAQDSFEVYRTFMTTSYAAPTEEGDAGVGDRSVLLLSTTPSSPATSFPVLLASQDDVTLLIQGSCLECTPQVEGDAFDAMGDLATAFFAP